MTSSHHCTICHPTDHGWTSQLYTVTFGRSDDDPEEFIVRARTDEEAAFLFMLDKTTHSYELDDDLTPHTAGGGGTLSERWEDVWSNIIYIFRLPSRPGPVGIVAYRGGGDPERYPVCVYEQNADYLLAMPAVPDESLFANYLRK